MHMAETDRRQRGEHVERDLLRGAGSTRMGAGTAQKIALNMLSTLAAIRLGHVHDGYMVNLHADNAKLHGRAARIVQSIAGCDEKAAIAALEKTGGRVKLAVLVAAGAGDPDAAGKLLDGAGQKLRRALSRLGAPEGAGHRPGARPAKEPGTGQNRETVK